MSPRTSGDRYCFQVVSGYLSILPGLVETGTVFRLYLDTNHEFQDYRGQVLLSGCIWILIMSPRTSGDRHCFQVVSGYLSILPGLVETGTVFRLYLDTNHEFQDYRGQVLLSGCIWILIMSPRTSGDRHCFQVVSGYLSILPGLVETGTVFRLYLDTNHESQD